MDNFNKELLSIEGTKDKKGLVVCGTYSQHQK
jgi:hypothetical protein